MVRTLAVLAAGLVFSAAFSVPIKRANGPAISPDGKTVIFSWQGDLWSVSAQGGRAVRLTVHPANDRQPRFTPDGKQVVFSSDRFGSPDLHVMNVDGTGLRRLTYDSGTELANSVSPDGKFVIGITNAFSAGRVDLFRVPLAGGEMIRMTDHPFEQEFWGTYTPDGTKVVYNRGAYGTAAWQKAEVRASALPDIWIADNTVPLSNHRPLLRSEATEMNPQVAPNGTMYYLSNAGGWPNIWRSQVGTNPGRQITNHKDGTVRNLHLSQSGNALVYEFDSDLYVLDTASGETKKLEIDVPDDQRTNPEAEISLTSGVDAFDVSPDGKRTVLNLRSDLFLIPERGGTTRRLTTNVAADEMPAWIDNKTILYVRSDKGKRDLYSVDLEGNHKPFVTDPVKDLVSPVPSPDRKMVAFHMGAEEIAVVPAAGGTPKVLLKGNYTDSTRGDVAFSWSPDNEWLVVAQPTDRGTNITLVQVSSGKQIIVARAPRSTSVPRFLPNGRGVYFTAVDNTDFESGIYVVDLVPREVEFTEDDLDKIDAPREARNTSVKVEVYENGIEYRLRRLANAEGDVIASPDSRALWTTVNGAFSSISLTGGAPSPVAAITGSARSLKLSGGKLYYVGTGSRLFSWTPGSPAAGAVNFNAQYTLNLRDEEQALFDEVWWAIDRFYYDPSFHGKSWPAIKQKFAKIVPFCFDRTDFYNLMGEMMEELNSSHLGSTAPTPPAVPGFGNDSTAYLGVEFDPKEVALGRYIVSKVVTGSAASHPSSLLKVGDRLVSVDGQRLNPAYVLGQALNRKAGRKVVLGVERGDQVLNVQIRPDSSGVRSNLFYEDFVAWQREQVDKLSNGQLAYAHIRGMDEPSYQRFLREIRTLTPGKKGLVLDVRYNGGGSTAHKILSILIKEPWLIRTTRGPQGIRLSENIYRGDSLELPGSLLFNSYSFSNAEIIGEGFRKLGIGPSVGERTPGYVIGTGGYTLWDGGFIRMPAIGAYAVNGDNLENDGRKPDFNVPFDPNAWSKGLDPQIAKAVQELLKKIG